MKKAKLILAKLLNPPKRVLFTLPITAFAALVFVFVGGQENNAAAYVIYVMSAYSLAIIIMPIPKLVKKSSQPQRRKYPARSSEADTLAIRHSAEISVFIRECLLTFFM